MSLGDKCALFRRMLEMRRFEEKVIALGAAGQVTGHFHVYIGQEATGAGVTAALGPRDMVFSTHRNHGHFVARGGNVEAGLAEILGRATGTNGGMGGSLHIADPGVGMPHTSAVLGAAPALAMGAAFQLKRMARDGDTDRIAVAFFGDGALEEGLALEALNFAALWQLPVLFVCENNAEGAIGAPGGGYPGSIIGTERLCALPEAFGIRTLSLDGTDPETLRDATGDTRAAMLSGGGPVFVEALTPRWFGNQGLWPDLRHGPVDLRMAVGALPLPDEDTEWFTRHDPVLRAVRELVAAGVAFGELARIDREVGSLIDRAADRALAAPFPGEQDARAVVFAGEGRP